MLALLFAYYTNPGVSSALTGLAEFKRCTAAFVIVASITAGALIPELFLIFFQRGCQQ
jgi:hypothetical protein